MQCAKTKDSEVVKLWSADRKTNARATRFSSSMEKRLRQDGFPKGFKTFEFNGRNRGFQKRLCTAICLNCTRGQISQDRCKNLRLSPERNCEHMNLALTGCENTMEPKRTGQWNWSNSNGRETMEFPRRIQFAYAVLCLLYQNYLKGFQALIAL